MKETKRCTEAAKIMIPWGSEIKNYCPVHANNVILVGKAMGMQIAARLLEGEHQCQSIDPITEEEKQLNKDFHP